MSDTTTPKWQAPATQQDPAGWYVTGCSRLLDEDEAKAEARHIGGTARAIPLYTAPQPSTTSQAAEPVAWLRNTTDPQPHAVTNLKYRSAVDAKAGVEYIPVFAAPQPVARVPLDEASRLFDAGWKAAALFCDREDVVADGIIGFGACQQFEAAFSAPQPVAREPLTDWDMRGQLAASLHCWHRLTANEAEELVAFVQRIAAHGIKGGQHGDAKP